MVARRSRVLRPFGDEEEDKPDNFRGRNILLGMLERLPRLPRRLVLVIGPLQ